MKKFLKILNKNSGITLLSLVVSVIVLIILTGVTMKTIGGNDGLIAKAKEQKNEIITKEIADNSEISQLENKLAKDTSKEQDSKIVVVSLTSSNTTFSYSTTTWTNENVTVTISTSVSGYQLQYSIGNTTNWQNYTSSVVMTGNGLIYARLINGENAGGYVTGEVSNIDRVAPTTVIPTATSTTNSITVTNNQTDALSGVSSVEYALETGTTWGAYQSSNVFTGLTQNTTYHVKTKTTDKAGNSSESAEITVTTGIVTALTSSNTTFTYTPTTWTNGNVAVRISTTVTGYTLQYQVGSTTGSWTAYTFAESLFGIGVSNNSVVYARLWDGTNAGEYTTGEISNIDKVIPTVNTPTITAITTTGFTINETAQDTLSGISKIIWYYKSSTDSTYTSVTDEYTTMNGATIGTTTSVSKTHELTGLKEGTTYNVYVRVYDVAGNYTDTSVVDATPNITFTYNPTTWTNGNVAVTISTSITESQLQYSIGDTNNWQNYTNPVEMTDNGKIYARLMTGTNAGETITGEVTKIDRVAPTTVAPTATSTTNSITVTNNQTDALSGVSSVEYALETGTTWGAYQSSNSFTGLIQNTTYHVKTKTTDKAGNSNESAELAVTTGTVTALTTANTTFTYNPSTWTNDKVAVTIKTTTSGYTLQYQIGSTTGTWIEYSFYEESFGEISKISKDSVIYARLWDGTNAGEYITGEVSNIDNVAPTVNTPTITEITATGFTINETAQDSLSGISKIIWYYKSSADSTYTSVTDEYTTMNGATTGTITSINKTHTLTDLTVGTIYNVYARVYDVAGNYKDTGVVNASSITFVYTPDTWTNGNVAVTINTSASGYTLQYSVENMNNWQNYTTPIEMTDNGKIYARLVNGENVGNYVTGEVTKIDRVAPTTVAPTATSTTNSITVTNNQTDALSGVSSVEYALETGTTWGAYQSSNSFTGLIQNITYHVKTKTTDKAGNSNESAELAVTTGTVTALTSSNTTFAYTPTTWTNGNVAVRISTTVTGYTLQYQVGSTTGSWTAYTFAESLFGIGVSNNSVVYARLWDGTNAGEYATGEVSNIDKVAPTTVAPTATSTTNSITVTNNQTDALSGVSSVEYVLETGTTWGAYQSSNVFTGLIQNTTYHVKTKITDRAGNSSESAELAVTTGTVEELTSSNTTFTYTPSTYTNGNVTVGISTTVTGYTLQYQVGSTTGSWSDYTSILTATENEVIYARLWDGTNAGGYATGEVSNIDKVGPNAATISLASTSITTAESTTATVTQSDSQSGVNITSCKWAFNTTSSSIGTSSSSYTGGTFSATPQTITLSNTTVGTYYLHVLTVDKAGNAKEIISSGVTIKTAITVANQKGGGIISTTGNTTIKDDSSNDVIVPAGFKIASDSATDASNGVVIEDASGNQFVWIPVASSSAMYKAETKTLTAATSVSTNYYSLFRIRSGDSYTATTPGSTSGIREPDLVTGSGTNYDADSQYYNTILGYADTTAMATAFVADYEAMIDSVNTNKGFYVGRYELTGSVANPTEKSGTTIVNQNWYNLYKACKNVETGNSHAITNMMWGCTWDEIMSWLKATVFKADTSKIDTNSSSWGNYSGSVIATGSNTTYKANNIYDIAGNCLEWTQEAYNAYNRVYRGGSYSGYSDSPASGRYDLGFPDNNGKSNVISSRTVLYIR